MDQVNFSVYLDPKRLNVPNAPMKARVGHSVVAWVSGVPDDCTGAYMRVFTEHDAYFDIPLNFHPTLHYHKAYIVGTSFPKVGQFKWEVHATDYNGNRTALGCGLLDVDPFSVTSSPVEQGEPVTVARIPAEGGGWVDVQYVWDGFDWVAKATLED